jgi:hypothetical protein
VTFGATGEDDGVEVTDCVKEFAGVGDEFEVAEEARVGAEDAPELKIAELDLRLVWAFPEDDAGVSIEIGEDAIAVEEELGHDVAPL